MDTRSRALLLAGICAVSDTTLNAQIPDHDQWVPDGRYAVAWPVLGTSTVYVGGLFEQIGPPTALFAALDPVTARSVAYPHADSYVDECVPDGQGGWFGHGSFRHIGPERRQFLARVNADGTVHSWAPYVNGRVRALAVSDGVVYLGGEFTLVNGEPRAHAAAVDAETGALLDWDPAPDGIVHGLGIVGSSVYLGGEFHTVGGGTREFLAAVSTTDATLLPWSTSVLSAPLHMRANANAICADGGFPQVDGVGVSGFMALDPVTGASMATSPVTNMIWDIAMAGDTVYVCGAMAQVNGQNVNNAFGFLLSTGEVFWRPEPDAQTLDVDVHGSSVYLAGGFLSLNGHPRKYVAEVDRNTGLVRDWAPLLSEAASTVARIGDRVLVSEGNLQSCDGVARHNLAALDLGTGIPTDWAPPSVDGEVEALVVRDGMLYFAGVFHEVNGLPRNGMAAVDLVTGEVTDWAPEPQGAVRKVVLSGDTLFVSGEFSAVGGAPRRNLAALDITSGDALDWAPDMTGAPPDAVWDFCITGTAVYFCGNFTVVGGEPRPGGLAAVDRATGAVTPWTPELRFYSDPGVPWKMKAHEGSIYVTGYFDTVNGQPAQGLCVVDAVTGQTSPWTVAMEQDGAAYGLAFMGSSVYIYGAFAQVNGVPRNGLAELRTDDGTLMDWDLSPEFVGLWGPASWMETAGTMLLMATSVSQDSIPPSPYYGVLKADLPTAAATPPISAEGAVLYPNPAHDMVRLPAPAAHAREIVVLDAHGRMVLRTPPSARLHVASLPPGLYLVRMVDDAGRSLWSSRLVKAGG